MSVFSTPVDLLMLMIVALQRQAWLPYFDNVDAVIFLAPISCFNERLAEDPTVNRLADSLQLWKSVCASPLLARATLILFLNKCDLLNKKLLAGIEFNKYLTSYKGENNTKEVTRCKSNRRVAV